MVHQRVQRASSWTPTFQKRQSSLIEPAKTVQSQAAPASSPPSGTYTSPVPSDWMQQDPVMRRIMANNPVMRKILQQHSEQGITTEGEVTSNTVEPESVQLKCASCTADSSVQFQASELQLDSNPDAQDVQLAAKGEKSSSPSIQQVAATGFSGSSTSLPHLNQIQQSFGVDLSGVQAYIGGSAAAACQQMGAAAYASGDRIAFNSQPSLELAAHEAAHVVQQRSGKVQLAGGVGQVGDKYENHADAVAALVAAGESAAQLLAEYTKAAPNSVQKQAGDAVGEKCSCQDEDCPLMHEEASSKKVKNRPAAISQMGNQSSSESFSTAQLPSIRIPGSLNNPVLLEQLLQERLCPEMRDFLNQLSLEERQAVMEEAARRYNEIHRGSDKPVNPSSPNPRFPSDWIGIVDRVLSERFISKVRGEQAQENRAAQPAHIPSPEQLQLERKFLQSLPSEIKAKLGGEENYLSLVNYYPQLVDIALELQQLTPEQLAIVQPLNLNGLFGNKIAEAIQDFKQSLSRFVVGNQRRNPNICGPDITSPLTKTLSKVRNTFGGWSRQEKRQACDSLISIPGGLVAWDISELHYQEWISMHLPGVCATPGDGKCSTSVEVENQCYYAGSVNYVVFGLMCKLCFESTFEPQRRIIFSDPGARVAVYLYKGRIPGYRSAAPNYAASLQWAIAGYNGWPSGGSPPSGDRPKCLPSCPRPVEGEFQAVWGSQVF